jgi:hypothetical protein
MSPGSFIFFIPPCVLFCLNCQPESDSTRSYSSCLAPAPFVHFSKLLSKTRNHKKKERKRKKRDPSSISSQSVSIC